MYNTCGSGHLHYKGGGWGREREGGSGVERGRG